jgi:hypothetical protein
LTKNKHFFDEIIVSLYNLKIVFLLLNFYKKDAMKLIMWLVIGYLGYKFWLQPKLLKSGNQEENNFKEKDNSSRKKSNYDDDYVDYEEIDE